LQRATFGSGIDPGSLVLADALPDPATLGQISGVLVVVAEVFAPSALPANVRLEWWRDGELLRVSREVEITAHAQGFRVWDSWRPDSGSVIPGHYRVILRTSGRRVFGVATITVGSQH
jgi:hypothetical protein